LKVLIVVYEDKDKRDNLKTRMVDVRVDQMVAEFMNNDIPIQVLRPKEVKEWDENSAVEALDTNPGLQAFRAMKKYLGDYSVEAFLELLKEAD